MLMCVFIGDFVFCLYVETMCSITILLECPNVEKTTFTVQGVILTLNPKPHSFGLLLWALGVWGRTVEFRVGFKVQHTYTQNPYTYNRCPRTLEPNP